MLINRQPLLKLSNEELATLINIVPTEIEDKIVLVLTEQLEEVDIPDMLVCEHRIMVNIPVFQTGD